MAVSTRKHVSSLINDFRIKFRLEEANQLNVNSNIARTISLITVKEIIDV